MMLRFGLTDAERAALEALTRSTKRVEADRARALLLSEQGWTGRALGALLGVRADTVLHWRCVYRRGGIEALRTHCSPGRQARCALEVLEVILADPRSPSTPPWMLPRLQHEVEGAPLRHPPLPVLDQPSVAEKRGYAFRRPRHTLRGRQDRQAIAQSAEHLNVLKRQAEAGAIELLFADEAEASKHALFGARRHASAELIVQTASSKNSESFCNFLEHLKPLGKNKHVHLVLDNGSIHTSRKIQAVLARAQHWLTVEWLPSYAPELNDIERDWRHLKCHYLAHQTFINIDILERTLHRSIKDINHDRLQHG